MAYKLPNKFAGLRLIRLDGSALQSPYVVLQNATHVYSLLNNTAYEIADSDLSDLADDIPDQCDPIGDGNSNSLPIYAAASSLGSALTVGEWDVIVLDDNDYTGQWLAVLPAYYDGTNLWALGSRTAAAGGGTQPRATRPAGSEFRLSASNRRGRFNLSTRPARLSAGTIDDVRVDLDVSAVFGELYVQSVGVPTVTPLNRQTTSVTCEAVGPSFDGQRRDAQVILGGTVQAGEQILVQFTVGVDGGDGQLFGFKLEGLPAAA